MRYQQGQDQGQHAWVPYAQGQKARSQKARSQKARGQKARGQGLPQRFHQHLGQPDPLDPKQDPKQPCNPALNLQDLKPQDLTLQDLNLQNCNAQALKPQNCNAQALKPQNCNAQALNAQALSAQALNLQNCNAQALNAQARNAQALNPQNCNAQALNAQALSAQALNPQSCNAQALNPQALNPQALNPQALNPQALNPQALNPQSRNNQNRHRITGILHRLPVPSIARPHRYATSLAAGCMGTLLIGTIAMAEPIPFGRPLPGRSATSESAAPAVAPPTATQSPSRPARSTQLRRDRPSPSINPSVNTEADPATAASGGWLDTPSAVAPVSNAIPGSPSHLAPSPHGYVVVVPGETLAILDQVRQWDPEASFSTDGGRTVVQSAPLASLAAAQAVQSQWRSRGLVATVIPAPQGSQASLTQASLTQARSISTSTPDWGIHRTIATPGTGVAIASAASPTGTVDPAFLFAPPESTPPPPHRAGGVPITANLEPIPANAGSPPIGNADASRASLPTPPPIPPEFLAQAAPSITPGRGTSRPATQPVLPVATAADPYFILIEGSDRELAQVGDRLVSFGLPRASLSRQREPFGPHLRLGPFNSVDSARQWSNYLQRIHVAAQVYHNGWIVDATQAMR